ncbi:unnamed protein product, partial [Ectocarpus sp. 8 AP-2014]
WRRLFSFFLGWWWYHVRARSVRLYLSRVCRLQCCVIREYGITFKFCFAGLPVSLSLSLGVCGVPSLLCFVLPFLSRLATLFPGCSQRRRRRDFDGLVW